MKGKERKKGSRGSRSILLNLSSSHYNYFSKPQRRLSRCSWAIFLFMMQKSCKTAKVREETKHIKRGY